MQLNRGHSRIGGQMRGGRAFLVAGALVLAGLAGASNAAAQGPGVDVSIQKTAPPLSYGSGSFIEFTLNIQATGSTTATGVHVLDTVPAHMSFTSIVAPSGWLCSTPPPGGTGQISCTLASLPNGGSENIVVTMHVDPNVLPGVRITNTATVSANQPDPIPSSNTSSYSFLIGGGSRDTGGVYDAPTGTFFLKNTNAAGGADLAFGYGPGGAYVPLKGDWNSDGIDTVGVYNPATSTFFLKNTNAPGAADIAFAFGGPGLGYVPLSGDWDGDGVDTIGLYQPSSGFFFLRNSNSPGPADVVFAFGAGGAGYQPLAGDWDGDGDDSVGLYQPLTGGFFLKNTNTNGGADVTFIYGAPNSVAIVGDWDGDGLGRDTIGVYAPASAGWFLKNSNAPGPADLVFVYGPPFYTPIPGDWDGH